MKKKLLKIFFITIFILIFLSILFSFSNVFALTDIVKKVKDPALDEPEGKIKEIANPILTMIQTIIAGVAIAFIINDGIKLLTEPDPSERANLQRKIAYYFIGGILLFAPVTVLKMLSKVGESVPTP